MSSDHSKSDSPASSKVSLLSTETTSSTFAKTAKQKSAKHYLANLAKYASGGGMNSKAASAPNVASPASSFPTPTPAPTSQSQTTLVDPARQPPPKDYEAAFGALATSFGTAGNAPVVVKKVKKADAQPSPSSSSTSSAPRK